MSDDHASHVELLVDLDIFIPPCAFHLSRERERERERETDHGADVISWLNVRLCSFTGVL